MVTCDVCGHENSDAASECVACGHDELQSAPPETPPDPLATNVVVFRSLVVFSAVSYVVWCGLTFLDDMLYSRMTVEMLAFNGYDAIFVMPSIYFWLALVLSLACAVGLYRFSWPARLVFTLLTIFNVFLALFEGISIGTSIDVTIGGLMILADGGALAMMWTAPLNSRFQRL
ncbi:MAG: hypothetical protein WBC44_10970 [Planctomycetaceae bacterium]